MAEEYADDAGVSRRGVLAGVSGAIAAPALADAAEARGNPGSPPAHTPHRRYNIGIRPGHVAPGLTQVKRRAKSVWTVMDFEDLGVVVSGRFPETALDGLRKNPHVEYVEPDYTDYHLLDETRPWGIERIGADQLYTVDTVGTESEATVAVLDTGIDSDHPDLQHSSITGKSFDTQCGATQGTDCCPKKQRTCSGYNGNSCHEDWDDDDFHGTHVAGTVAADDDGKGVRGVVPGVDLLAGKIFNGCGNTSASASADAIRWATNQGADVINMSYGGPGNRTERKACRYAHDRNVVLVAAAGNSGPCTNCVDAPALYSTVIAVSNLSPGDSLRNDSSTGPPVELVAPGTDTYSTVPPRGDPSGSDGYHSTGGTSMSAPHVAGVAALIKDVTTLDTNTDIRARLRETAEHVDLDADDQGYGLVDAAEATNSILADTYPDRPQLTPFHTVFEITDEWFRFHFDEHFSDPVVVAGPATADGPDPTTVRVQNVDAATSTAEVRLQEWDALEPGTHTTEEVTVTVFESAHLAELNGAQAEAQHVDGVTTEWQRVSFQEYFSEEVTPVVLPQVVTENGDDAVTVRLRNVDPTGFDLRLQEQESKDDEDEGHVRERVDYVAVDPHEGFDSEAGLTIEAVTDAVSAVPLSHFQSRPDVLAHAQTTNGGDPVSLRIQDWRASGFDVFLDEEQSADAETDHQYAEQVGYLALEAFEEDGFYFETGTGTVAQPDADTWTPVRASAVRSFQDPVILMGPPTHEGGQPTTVRVRNVGTAATGSKSFEFQLDEWEYLESQSHVEETLSYGIFESGTGSLGAANVEAGYKSDVEDSWSFVWFDHRVFDDAPVVVVQCATQAGDDPVTLRTRNVSQWGFEVKLQEEEANGNHTTERVDFLAIEPGAFDGVEAGTTGTVVTDSPPTLRNSYADDVFEQFEEPPDFLASMQTTNGGDPAALRSTGWGATGFGVFVEEEQSATDETSHTEENVGYVAFESESTPVLDWEDGSLTRSFPDGSFEEVRTSGYYDPVVVMGPPTDYDSTPTTVRVRGHELDRFEYQLEEWEYQSGGHDEERISYAVSQSGAGYFDPGESARAEAGATSVDDNWQRVRFSLGADFETTPVVVPQLASDAGGDTVTVRIDNVTTEGFDVRVQEQERGKPTHTRERVDYLAVEPVATSTVVADTVSGVTDAPTRVDVEGLAGVPNVLAGMQTTNGGDPCTLRLSDVHESGFDVYVDEEQSADSEVGHIGETVGYVAFEP